jgi:D-glycero-alpha-D-manno-heptose-7-phosphate kinase
MIISRTPYRISLLGGGTDYKEWFQVHGGKVLSFTIDKYCYLLFRRLPTFFPFSNKIIYSKFETTNTVEEIQHPVVREVLKYYQVEGVELTHHGDLPAGGGLGSSSSFTVGMVNIMYSFSGGYKPHPKLLASEAIFIERSLLGERVGNQDQVSVAFGGLNVIDFFSSADSGFEFEVDPILIPVQRIKNLEKHLMLFYTGVPRKTTASTIASTYNMKEDLHRLSTYVDAGVKAIKQDNPKLLGELLELSWEFKKSLSPNVTNDQLDTLYDRAKKTGVIGGKLLGAGGGGFFLFCIDPSDRPKLLEEFKDLIHIPFTIEFTGSEVIVND